MAERILVVDDLRTNAEMVAGLLRNLGYEIEMAGDGEEALEMVRARTPDMVITDIMMPRMDGYELCQRLRAAPGTALLPVILVTSADPATERVKGIEAGADDFISKPVNWAELFGRVKRLLHVKALQDEIQQLNAKLEERVRDQVAQLERLSRMKRFFSRAVAEAIVAGGEELLEPHRREITAVFLDLRGFTA
ncbi:MAG TPA: response regulator, partial [Burkholderiales bacterium]|nr:response regulator [Burkholderiales bacterium]